MSAYFRTISFVLLSALAAVLGFLAFDPAAAESLYRATGYWNVLALVFAFAAVLLYPAPQAALLWLRQPRHLALLLACLAAAAFLYTREGGGFKIAFDEHLLSNVAKSLYEDHDPVVRQSTLMDIAAYEQIDKRPLLFPFLLSLVHSALGYDSANAFYLNFALTALFLLLLYTLLRKLANPAAGAFAVALCLFTPLIEQNASGGGFEMLNLCGLLAVAWLAVRYFEAPDPVALLRLALATALLSHVRYESVLLALPAALVAGAHWLLCQRKDLPLALLPLPLAFLPLAWQLGYIKTQPTYWQYSLGQSSFDLAYLPQNLSHAFNFLFLPDQSYPGSPPLAFLGVCGLLLLAAFSLSRRRELYQRRTDRQAALLPVLGILLQTGLVLCFTFGQLDNHIVSRLGLPLVVLLIAGAAILLAALSAQRGRGQAAAALLLVLIGAYGTKMYSHANYTRSNSLHKRIDMALDFARSLDDGVYLFISDMSRIFEIENINNLSTPVARLRGPQIAKHIDLMTYDAVFVIEHGVFSYVDGELQKQLIPESSLGPEFLTEPVEERSLLAHNFTRISRVLGYDPQRHDPEFHQSVSDALNAPRYRSLRPEDLLEWRKSLP